MLSRIRTFLIGPPLPTTLFSEKRLNKARALAAFSPDALSSIAYANQEIYLGLVVAGSLGLSMTVPVGIAITAILIIVAISYFQTIHGYPSGGGSYIVARANLGTLPGLVAASALMVDLRPLLEYLDQQDSEHNDGQQAAVVLPEFTTAHWWEALLHNQTSLLIRTALLYRRRIHGLPRVIIDVPYHLKR